MSVERESREKEPAGGKDRRDPARLSSNIRNCPLCGFDFAENEHEGCPSCPVNRFCRVLCCPNCGYEFVEDSWVIGKLRDLKARFSKDGIPSEEGTSDGA